MLWQNEQFIFQQAHLIWPSSKISYSNVKKEFLEVSVVLSIYVVNNKIKKRYITIQLLVKIIIDVNIPSNYLIFRDKVAMATV